jgi:hypothetical protein
VVAQSMPLRVPVPRFSVGTLAVRVHSTNIDGSSDGTIAVRVRTSGHTRQDPSRSFAGPTVALVTAADKDTAAPRYATQAFYAEGDLLEVEIEGQQDSSSGGLALEAAVSLSMTLDEGKVLPPTAIFQSNLASWWDGRDATTAAWNDRVGGRVASATAGEEPSIGTLNGRPAPGYASPGANVDGYKTSSAKSWFEFLHDGTGGTIALAARSLVAGGGAFQYLFDEIRATATRTGISVFYNTADALQVRVGNSSGSLVASPSVDVSAKILQPHFLIFRLDTAQSTDWSLFVDQGDEPDVSGNVAVTPAQGAATLNPRLIARSAGTTTNALDGYCGEIIIADTFASDLQVEQLARYLTDKYL